MPRSERPKWDAVLLICKQCRKRSNGPRDVKSKALGKIARGYLKGEKPRPRVVSSSCLGVCPKQATAVAFIGRGAEPQIVSIESADELAAAMPMLVGL